MHIFLKYDIRQISTIHFDRDRSNMYFRLKLYWAHQGALKPGSVGALLPGNLLSHRKFEVKLGNNARNFLSPQSVVTFLLLF